MVNFYKNPAPSIGVKLLGGPWDGRMIAVDAKASVIRAAMPPAVPTTPEEAAAPTNVKDFVYRIEELRDLDEHNEIVSYHVGVPAVRGGPTAIRMLLDGYQPKGEQS